MSAASLLPNGVRVNFEQWDDAFALREILHEDEGHGTWLGWQLHVCADGNIRTAPQGVCSCGALYCAECDEVLQ